MFTHRRTWPGVVIAIVRGRQHFDTQRRGITDRHEAERMTLRRAFTATDKGGLNYA